MTSVIKKLNPHSTSNIVAWSPEIALLIVLLLKYNPTLIRKLKEILKSRGEYGSPWRTPFSTAEEFSREIHAHLYFYLLKREHYMTPRTA